MALRRRVAAAWQALCGAGPATDQEQLLALRGELAGLRLELQESREALQKERGRIERLQQQQAGAVQDSTQARVLPLLTALSAPLSQLDMQKRLHESGTPLEAADVLAVAEQVARAGENAGLEALHSPGELTGFDPETMQPLRADQPLEPGEEVTVKCAGYRYQSHVLRKALVQRGE